MRSLRSWSVRGSLAALLVAGTAASVVQAPGAAAAHRQPRVQQANPTASLSTTGHPRLLFGASDVASLRARVQSGPLALAWADLKQKADAYTDPTNPAYANPAYVQLPNGGDFYDGLLGQNQMDTYLTDLGMAYVISGDAKYGDQAIALMLALAAADWPAWDDNELGRGDLSRGVALAFDWTYDLMTPAQRQTIVSSLTTHEGTMFSCLYSAFAHDHGGVAATDQKLPIPPGHNWDSVCGGGNGLLLLAIYGEPGAPSDIDQRLGYARTRVLQVVFGANGDGQEGINYADYGLHNGLPFMFAWQRLEGEDLVSQDGGLTSVPRWLAYEQLPGQGNEYIPRNDGGSSLPLFHEVMSMLLEAAPNGTTAWLWDHTIGSDGDHIFASPEGVAVSDVRPFAETPFTGEAQCTPPADASLVPGFCWSSPEVFAILYYRSTSELPRVDPATSGPLAQQYAEHGLVDFRTGWSGGANELAGTFEIAHDHVPNDGHNQEDLGNFTLYGYGSGFALDSGYGHQYPCGAAAQYTQHCDPQTFVTDNGRAVAHNVVIIDDNRDTQRVDGPHQQYDAILGYLDSSYATLVRGDTRAAYSATLTAVPDAGRDLMFSRAPGEPVILAVTDHLDRDGASHTYAWRLHTAADNAVAIVGAGFRATAPNGATMIGRVASVQGQPSVTLGVYPQPGIGAVPPGHTVIVSTPPAGVRLDHLAVLALTSSATTAAASANVTASGGEVLDVTWTGGEALVASTAYGSSGVTSSRLTTDAELAKVTLGKAALALAHGSTLVADGTTYVTVTGGKADLSLSGTSIVATGPAGATYRVRAPNGVTSVVVNGTPVAFCQQGPDVVFPLAC